MTDIIVAETEIMKRLTGLDPYEGTRMHRKKYVLEIVKAALSSTRNETGKLVKR